MSKAEEIISEIKPLADRVLVRPFPEKAKISGIIIPEGAREKPQRGEVVAAGPGVWEDHELVPLDVKPGDKILFGKHSGAEIDVAGEKLLIMRQDDILGTIKCRN